jgi:exodeoxyribonuclease VII large subunit
LSTDWPFDRVTGELLNEPPRNAAEYSVSELSAALKRTLEESFGYVRVRGEIGRVTSPGSGHCYLDLKDDRAVISAVIWKTAFSRLRIKPEQGLEVIVTGKVTTFPGQSKYQIVIETIEPAGIGALMALLEDRKKRLMAEGLFDAAHKKPIPYLPEIIGIVTSPTGAVIRDILHRLADRFPRHVLLWPVRVQGEQCAAEVARAISGFNALSEADPLLPRPDLIIVARGGGSIEDLWGFNEEVVVRAAAASAIPLISAVGHETDWTLIDYAADLRAPTPTAAAERAVPVRSDLIDHVQGLSMRMRRCAHKHLEDRRARVVSAGRGLPRPDDLLAFSHQRFDNAGGRLKRALEANTRHHRSRYERCAAKLSPRMLERETDRLKEIITRDARRLERCMHEFLRLKRRSIETSAKLLNMLSHRSVLQRGFALVMSEGSLIADAAAAAPGMQVTIEFHDASVGAHIEGAESRRVKLRPRKKPSDAQGSLL